MERKKFLLIAAAAIPAILIGQNVKNPKPKRQKKGFIVKAGDTIFLPRNIPHTWIQLSDNGKLIYFLQPAGKMEEFFIKMSTLKGKPTDEEIQKITMEHGMKNIGPPLQL